MHIFLCSTYHISAYLGGNEQYFHHLALGLRKAKHDVTYITGKANNVSEYPYRIISLPLHHFLAKPLPSLDWFNHSQQLKADIFHASGSGLPIMAAAISFRNKHIPTILTYQADNNPSSVLMALASNFEQYLIKNTYDAIITTSPFYEAKLKQRWSNKTIRFIPMMLPSLAREKVVSKTSARKSLDIGSSKKIVLFVGNLSSHHYYKGVDILLNAAITLPENYQVIFVGKGDRLDYYRQISINNQLLDKVAFPGFVPNEVLPLYYQSADVFVLPSTSNSEGFGLVLLEAMSYKVPTITTTAIASAEWFKEQQVTQLVSPNDLQALAQVIKNTIKKPPEQMIKKAYDFSKAFTLESMVKNTVQLYENLLS